MAYYGGGGAFGGFPGGYSQSKKLFSK